MQVEIGVRVPGEAHPYGPGSDRLDAERQAAVREAVRKALSDTTYKYQTAMGEISFDKNGDTSQKTVSVYSVDLAAANGKGAWTPKKEITFE